MEAVTALKNSNVDEFIILAETEPVDNLSSFVRHSNRLKVSIFKDIILFQNMSILFP